MAPMTTFGTGPGRTPRPPGSLRPPSGSPGGVGWGRALRPAFTLMELLLAAIIIAVLLSLSIASFTTWHEKEKLPEGARQYEAILRLARAEAAAQGRRIRLVFDADTQQAHMYWEPQPLEEPGNFVPHPGNWAHRLPDDLVRISRCQRTHDSAYQSLTYRNVEELESEDGQVLQSLTFYPDGSCDSALLELVGREGSEQRTAIIEMDGTNGMISMRIMTPSELEEFYEEARKP